MIFARVLLGTLRSRRRQILHIADGFVEHSFGSQPVWTTRIRAHIYGSCSLSHNAACIAMDPSGQDLDIYGSLHWVFESPRARCDRPDGGRSGSRVIPAGA